MSIRKTLCALALGGLAFAVAPTVASASPQQPVIGLAVANLQASFFNMIKQSVVKEGKAHHVKVITVDAHGDPAAQVHEVQDLISRHIDALIYIPAGPTAAAVPVQMAQKAHVPVVAVDRNPPSDPATTFIATDSVGAARHLGDYACKLAGGKGQVAIVEGQIGTTPQVARSKGWAEAMKKCPGLHVVAQQGTKEWDAAEGYRVAQNMLERDPHIKVIFGQADQLALGAERAVRGAHLNHKVIVVGFDGDPSGLQGVKAGTIDATMCQHTFYMGRLAFKSAMDLIHGKSVPKEQLQPATLTTKANVGPLLKNHP